MCGRGILVLVPKFGSCDSQGGAGHYLQDREEVGATRTTSANQAISPSPNERTMLAKAGKSGLSAMISSGRTLSVTTWNVAAINNNPFEYWLTVDDDPEYNHLMESVEKFVEDPGSEMDVPVNKVFTDDMFDRLERRMVGNDVGWPSVRDYWTSDYRDRKIVSGFLKDKTLGSKRLASMPDRVTNTINVANSVEPVCRPTVINMYGGDLSDMGIWMDEYEKFLFDSKLSIRGKDGKDEERRVCDLLLPIKKSKCELLFLFVRLCARVCARSAREVTRSRWNGGSVNVIPPRPLAASLPSLVLHIFPSVLLLFK